VSGEVASGFERVRAAFEQNFSERGELGAAVAAVAGGKPVVDLWGGSLDGGRSRPWRAETIVLVFPATKGLAAAAVAVAQSRGLLDYEAPVSRYWPEFAEAGKVEVTVRQLLAHQAGLCALDVRLDAARIGDWEFLTAALARQRPLWEPGRRHGYHAFTLGWYESELLRRVDPKGRRLPAFFADEVARPLGADFHIGLPEDRDPAGVATIHGWPGWKMMLHLGALPPRMVLAYMNPRSLTARTMGNPRLASPAEFDSEEYRHIEMPAGVGFGSARAIAAIYGDLAAGGRRLGLRAATLDALTAAPVSPTAAPTTWSCRPRRRIRSGGGGRSRAFALAAPPPSGHPAWAAPSATQIPRLVSALPTSPTGWATTCGRTHEISRFGTPSLSASDNSGLMTGIPFENGDSDPSP
jgi:CubicO group peptidase (beta-lactamase class C family)